ncbi:hypothetical protein [Luteolibacter soli]|uniref:Lipoprotein n=1 Tax=Luteolibacter soli TaxID=3135280 RepID=A0ABU9AXL4_9BACT
MKTILLSIIIPLLLLITACSRSSTRSDFAHLGETMAECEKRCGKPVKPPTGTEAYYRNGDYIIHVTFWNGQAATVSSAKGKPGGTAISHTPLTSAEQETLLKANDAGSTWSKDKDSDDEMTTWSRADDKAEASYMPKSGILLVTATAYQEFLHEQKKQERE